jgi:predicted permease
MRSILYDLRFFARTLRKSWGFGALAVLTLGVGIGANATLFGWLSAILLTGLPAVADPQGLVSVFPRSTQEEVLSVSYPEYRDLRDRSKTLAGLIVSEDLTVNLATGGEPERVWGELVSGNFFDVLGVEPMLGRTFSPDEDRVANAHPVVVLGYDLWQSRFAGDPAVVGRSFTLNGHPFTVIGVAPRDFQGDRTALRYELWVPMLMQEKVVAGGSRLESRGNAWLSALGRLAPGVSPQGAQAELEGIARELAREHPAVYASRTGMRVVPFWKSPRGAQASLAPVLFLLMGVVAMVLLLACANVANLLLARATSRRREVAVRVAVGAGRGRILRQLLTESVALSLLAGVVGLAIAYLTSDLLRALAPPTGLPIGLQLGIDGRVLGFTLLLAVLTGVRFGLVPALGASRSDVAAQLRDESGTFAGGPRGGWLRNGLVLVQVAISLLLLVAAGLLLRSLESASGFDPGFEPGGVELASIDLFPTGYTPEKGRQLYRQLLERLRALPGVDSVSLARGVPLGLGGSSSSRIRVEGYEPAKDQLPWTYLNNVGPDYLRTMGMRLVRGRDLTEQDDFEAPRVAVINQTMAERYWPGREALGRRFSFDGERWITVVGVVADSKYRSLSEPPAPFTYLPLQQFFASQVTLHVRAAPASGIAASLRREVQALDPGLPVFDQRRLEEHVRAASFQQRMAGTLLSVLGVLALLLAAVGIYGVLAYAVGQRTREMGLRMALGAAGGDILRLVLRQGMKWVLLGMSLGLASASALTRLMRSLLFGVSATDPLSFAAAATLLGLVALAACYLPAWRASRMDPLLALRYE